MSTDGRTIKIPIFSEFFVLHFLLAPHRRYRESYDCGRLPGDVVKRSINSNPLCSRIHTTVTMDGAEIPAGKCEDQSCFSGRDIWRRVAKKNALGNLSLFALSLSFSPCTAWYRSCLFFHSSPDRPIPSTNRPAGYIN